MRRVTRHAAFCLDRRMLKSKRPGFVRMAVEAELVLRGGGAELVRQKPSMGVMAVAARKQTFIHLVMKWLGEIRLYVQMAGVAELRLGQLQQLRLDLRRVDGMAIHTTNIIFDVLRTEKISVLLPEFMAAKAALG